MTDDDIIEIEPDEWDETTRLDGVTRCRECGGPSEAVENWRPPASAQDAWEWAVSVRFACTHTAAGADLAWSFCPRSGGAWIGGMRVDYERRRSGAAPWTGEERRLLR